MDDLISRQAAIDAIRDMQAFEDDNGQPYLYLCDVMAVFTDEEELPSIQPEIVRCGECKWFQCNMSPDGYLPQGVDEFECRHWCGSCDPTDFCSYAERRTNG